MMKVVNVVDLFFPDAGYENNIISKYFISFGHEYIILTTDIPDPNNFFVYDNIYEKDEEFFKKTGVKVIRVHCKKFISGRSIWDYSKFKTIIREIQPDIISFCGNDTYIAMRFLADRNSKHQNVIMDSHMLSMASKNKLSKIFHLFYRLFFAPIIIKRKIKVIRVQDDDYVEKCLGIPLTQCPWVSFGSDLQLFYPDKDIKNEFRKDNNIKDDEFVIIYAGKLDESKGGLFLAQAFKDEFVNKKVVLIVVGNTSGEYGNQVENVFKESKNKIIRFSTQKYMDLPKFYQSADLAVFPKQCSLSFYDLQACGVPILSEDNNINVDRCKHNNGWNFKSGDLIDFRNKIEEILSMEKSDYENVSKNSFDFIYKNYNYEDKAREYEKYMLEGLNNK